MSDTLFKQVNYDLDALVKFIELGTSELNASQMHEYIRPRSGTQREAHVPTAKEIAFHRAMLIIYKRAKRECGYNATRFLQMVTEHGGVETARILLRASSVSEGYAALWERGRLDLSVEAVILQPPWRELFSDAERETARCRLQKYGYGPSGDD